jgi:small subunit ribosomal protein S20
MKTAERDRQKNKRVRTTLRAAVKSFKESKPGEGRNAEFKELTSTLDSAARKGIIHKNKAARTKSRLAKLVKGK